jgi:hypothetical protein
MPNVALTPSTTAGKFRSVSVEKEREKKVDVDFSWYHQQKFNYCHSGDDGFRIYFWHYVSICISEKPDHSIYLSDGIPHDGHPEDQKGL